LMNRRANLWGLWVLFAALWAGYVVVHPAREFAYNRDAVIASIQSALIAFFPPLTTLLGV